MKVVAAPALSPAIASSRMSRARASPRRVVLIPHSTYPPSPAAASAVMIWAVPITGGEASTLMLAAIALNGLLANAVQTAMYALAAHVYPTAIRASGVAYAASIGRVGGILSSIFGAAIIGMGAGAYWGFIAIAMVIVFAGLALVGRHFPAQKADPAKST